MKARHLVCVRLGAIVAGCLFSASAVLSSALAHAPQQKPNILVITGDAVG
jgi:uncharacterized membrane protein